MIAQHLKTVLAASTSIPSSVMVYPVLLPESSPLPAITYQIISGVAEPTFDTTGMRKYRVQVDCWANSYATADTLRDQVIATLDGYSDGVILNCWMAMVTDFYAHTELQYRAMVEFYALSAQ